MTSSREGAFALESAGLFTQLENVLEPQGQTSVDGLLFGADREVWEDRPLRSTFSFFNTSKTNRPL